MNVDNETFMIMSSIKNNGQWQKNICNMDLHGNITTCHYYGSANTTVSENWTAEAMQTDNNKYAVSGRIQELPIVIDNFYYKAFLMLMNEECDSTAFYTYRYNNNNTASLGMCISLDEQFVLTGFVNFNNQSMPWLLKVNEMGETQWEHIYVVENEYENSFNRCNRLCWQTITSGAHRKRARNNLLCSG